ncbi:MAG: OmpH family outer membrane protein [Vicinamibacterales bacterium]|jgi:Skp family chaperone for outer membrane proteins|nr:OmpH family outer membrane protein [Vicinamibacterales bacterium]
MKLLSVVAAMMVALVALTAPARVAAEPQAPAQPPAPAQTPAPAQAPPPTAQPPQTAPAPARLPFPTGAQHAYIDLQRVANESSEGQAASQQVQALSEEKIRVIETRSVELQGSQQKLQQNANVMSAEAQLQLQREIDRLNIEVQRLTQDAEAEVAELQQTLQIEFQLKLVPAIDRVAASRGLQFIFSVGDGGLIWANPALDITTDVVEELNKAAQPTP